MIEDLYKDSLLLTFQQLQINSNITSKDFFKYLRLPSVLSRVAWSDSPTPLQLIKFYEQTSLHRKGISYIYKLLMLPET